MIDIESDNMNQIGTTQINGLGARLKSAREAMSLTPKEAAAHLHLSANIIDIIEKEQFADGPPPTFMRGYLRSYARFLNVPDHEIGKTLQELDISMPIKNMTPPILHTRSTRRSDRYLHWITYLVIATMIALVALWWHSQQRYVISDVPTKATPAPLTTETSQVTNPGVSQDTSTPLPAASQPTENITASTHAIEETASTPATNTDPAANTNDTSAATAPTTAPAADTTPTDAATASPTVSPVVAPLAAPSTAAPTTTPANTGPATPPPQVDLPPIISNTPGIGLSESQIPPVTALPTTPAKSIQKHKRPVRNGTLPGMPSVNMALPEPG